MSPSLRPNFTRLMAVRAQAALWVTRLHSGERTTSDLDQFYRWFDQCAMNRDAFEAVTASWDVVLVACSRSGVSYF